MSRKPKLVVIVGPTASGKTELAIHLAKKFDGEIVSADSQQVYRGLSIGTTKVKGAWKKLGGKKGFVARGVRHYCIDFVPPQKKFTVAEFKLCADRAIQNITERGKLPILVGGTGFWADTVAYGKTLPPVPPNQTLRRALEKKNLKTLLTLLAALDPARAKTVDRKNPRRIIRAIEIAKSLGEVPPIKKTYPYQVRWIGIAVPEKKWQTAAAKRARRMVRSGIIAETRRLLRAGISKKRMREFGFEYSAVLRHLGTGFKKTALADEIAKDTVQFRKRQIRWFTRNRAIQWIHTKKEAEKLIENFL